MTLPKGLHNCITDVEGVKVGHVTLEKKVNDTDFICTGVTAILPHNGNLFADKVRAACHVINGFGKTCGLVQIDELGLLESPIMLTNTFSVGPVLQGTLSYMLDEDETIGDSTSSLNIVVGECNDSYLNSMRMQAVESSHAIKAIREATSAPTEEGAIGAGKGMVCFGYKGGIGTASRKVGVKKSYTVGTLVLSNFGKRSEALFADWTKEKSPEETPDGSIMMVLATDAPLSARQLKRLAKRSAAGLGRLGSHYSNGSGDIAIAFSTSNRYQHETMSSEEEQITVLRDDHPIMNNLFQAVAECIEEAVLNALRKAETTHGRKGRVVKKAPL